jgi:hypothetical protein
LLPVAGQVPVAQVRPAQQGSPLAPQWTQVLFGSQVNGSAHQLNPTLKPPPPPPLVPRQHRWPAPPQGWQVPDCVQVTEDVVQPMPGQQATPSVPHAPPLGLQPPFMHIPRLPEQSLPDATQMPWKPLPPR